MTKHLSLALMMLSASFAFAQQQPATPEPLNLDIDDQIKIIDHEKNLLTIQRDLKISYDKMLATPEGKVYADTRAKYEAENISEVADADKIINKHHWKGHFDTQTKQFVPAK